MSKMNHVGLCLYVTESPKPQWLYNGVISLCVSRLQRLGLPAVWPKPSASYNFLLQLVSQIGNGAEDRVCPSWAAVYHGGGLAGVLSVVCACILQWVPFWGQGNGWMVAGAGLPHLSACVRSVGRIHMVEGGYWLPEVSSHLHVWTQTNTIQW